MEVHTVGVCEFFRLHICYKYSTTDVDSCQEKSANKLTTYPSVSQNKQHMIPAYAERKAVMI